MIILKKGWSLHAVSSIKNTISCIVTTSNSIVFENFLHSSEIQIMKATISDINISEIKLINNSHNLVEGIFFTIKNGNKILPLLNEIKIQPLGYYINNENGVSETEIPIIEEKYITKLDTSTSNFTYIGKASINSIDSNPVWQIKLINESISPTTILFAEGTEDFINIWDNRLSYTYS